MLIVLASLFELASDYRVMLLMLAVFLPEKSLASGPLSHIGKYVRKVEESGTEKPELGYILAMKIIILHSMSLAKGGTEIVLGTVLA